MATRTAINRRQRRFEGIGIIDSRWAIGRRNARLGKLIFGVRRFISAFHVLGFPCRLERGRDDFPICFHPNAPALAFYDFALHDFAHSGFWQNHGGQNHEDEGIELLGPTRPVTLVETGKLSRPRSFLVCVRLLKCRLPQFVAKAGKAGMNSRTPKVRSRNDSTKKPTRPMTEPRRRCSIWTAEGGTASPCGAEFWHDYVASCCRSCDDHGQYSSLPCDHSNSSARFDEIR